MKSSFKDGLWVPIVASLGESVITHPMDVFRTRYTNRTVLWRGICGLYSGFGYRAIGLIPNRIVFLGGDTLAKQYNYNCITRGIGLGALQSIVDLPFLMWRTSAMEGLPQRWTHFPKGLVPLMGRNVLFALGLFGTRDYSPFQNSYFNTCLGCVLGVSMSQPFEVIRVQKQSISRDVQLSEIIKKTYVSRGMFGFWRGVLPRGGIAIVSFLTLTFFQKHLNAFV
jgi:hypothetical protein